MLLITNVIIFRHDSEGVVVFVREKLIGDQHCSFFMGRIYNIDKLGKATLRMSYKISLLLISYIPWKGSGQHAVIKLHTR